jgi:hypothetical protein
LLWDELTVTIPAAGDPYRMAEEIRTLVERETDPDSAEASQDWERVTSKYGARSFSARPAVNLRPGVNGLEVAVRYITRAPQRKRHEVQIIPGNCGSVVRGKPAGHGLGPATSICVGIVTIGLRNLPMRAAPFRAGTRLVLLMLVRVYAIDR